MKRLTNTQAINKIMKMGTIEQTMVMIALDKYVSDIQNMNSKQYEELKKGFINPDLLIDASLKMVNILSER